MAEESFLLVSLEGNKSKKLAEVISNDTCRKMLDALAKKEHTETELSESMGIPLSTVHYNLKNLVEARLVLANEYHYSKRGKEILHYKLANKLIIIAPQEAEASKIGDILKKYLSISAGIIAVSAVLEFFTLRSSGSMLAKASSQAFDTAAQEGAIAAPRLMAAAAPLPIPVVQEPSIAAWFAIGAFTAMFIILIFELLKNARKKQR